MIIGFTGTRTGMTPQQLATMDTILRRERPRAVHHGDCIGADAQFDRMCRDLAVPSIHVHPALNTAHRAHTADHGGAVVHPPLPPLQRNRTIVAACTLLVATPYSFREQRRSGTWATVRYARAAGIATMVIAPDGTVSWDCIGRHADKFG